MQAFHLLMSKAFFLGQHKADLNLYLATSFIQMSTYCSPHCCSGATRMDNANLCFVAKIVQWEDFFLVLQQHNLGKARGMLQISIWPIAYKNKKSKIPELYTTKQWWQRPYLPDAHGKWQPSCRHWHTFRLGIHLHHIGGTEKQQLGIFIYCDIGYVNLDVFSQSWWKSLTWMRWINVCLQVTKNNQKFFLFCDMSKVVNLLQTDFCPNLNSFNTRRKQIGTDPCLSWSQTQSPLKQDLPITWADADNHYSYRVNVITIKHTATSMGAHLYSFLVMLL